MTRARYPDIEDTVARDGASLHYEVCGEGEPTVFLLPTWSIIHSRAWKAQIPYFARHFRVLTFDGLGNGKSDRPNGPEYYTWGRQVADAVAVMDATGTDKTVVIGNSNGGHLAALLASRYPDRVVGAVLIAATPPFGPDHDRWPATFEEPLESYDGWNKWNVNHWRENYRDFVEWFEAQAANEPHSTKQIEDMVGWAMETTPDTLIDTLSYMEGGGGEEVYRNIECPVLLIHGRRDLIVPLEKSEYLAGLCGGRLHVVENSGHAPQGRFPARTNLVLKDFIDEVAGKANGAPPKARPTKASKRVLYLSSPIGLGHGRRDLAIARELKQLHPGLEIDWLAQHPVTALLDAAGERVHSASHLLANKSKHIEAEADGHDLHVFEALRRMDEILVANFMLFHEVVADGDYDLILGDEAWDVDHFWHEHPELKAAQLVWFTDFVGFLPMPDKGERDIFLTTDYNAEMIEHVEGHPGVRDRSIFVGAPEDCVDMTMGPGLPDIRDWTEKHFDFCGYITGFDPAGFGSREALRAELGYGAGEKVCIVTVGGSGVGRPLLERVLAGWPMAKRKTPELRMIAVAGPRIDPAELRAPDGVELRAFVPDLHRHLAACDLAIVQGGLTTCMELTAAGAPFIYVPLRNHVEQNFHVHHRLKRYGAGRRMDYGDCDPDSLAAAIADALSRPAGFATVETGGARRAAEMVAELL